MSICYTIHIIHKWPDKALRVETAGVPLGEWVHLGFSYDGSGKAEGIKLFINGEEKKTTITNNSLMRMPRGFLARGRVASTTIIGTSTVRAQ